MSANDQTPSNLPAGIWQDLLRHAYSLIDEIAKHGIHDSVWTFGGGTVLMLRHHHRVSKDIDIKPEDILGTPVTITVRTRSDKRFFHGIVAEFAFHECLPIAAGGLGALAGDHAKSASDLGVRRPGGSGARSSPR